MTLFFPGQPSHRTPIYGVVGTDIADLQILPTPKKTVSQQQQQPIMKQAMPTPTPPIQSINSHSHSILVQEQSDRHTDAHSPHLVNTNSNSTSTRTTVVYSHEDIHLSSRPQQQKSQKQQPSRSHHTEKVTLIEYTRLCSKKRLLVVTYVNFFLILYIGEWYYQTGQICILY